MVDVIISTLYAIAMFVLILYGANLLYLSIRFVQSDRLREGTVPNEILPSYSGDPSALPPVTIQLPVFNEKYVVERLIDTVCEINYPLEKLQIQVLDDSTDETVDIIAAKVHEWAEKGLDIVHIHRVDRSGYKAGALQNGLLTATGKFVGIFDADFLPPSNYLMKIIPFFDDEKIGMVQARWGHINGNSSLLTKIQAASLDAHFGIEQLVRNRIGCFMNFNGTAGVWRVACIEDAGGWEGDTLTEDLDLSYRAQLKSWQFRMVPELEVPAEIPDEINSFRAQQFRWTKGAAETSIKLLNYLWSSKQKMKVKFEGTLHLTNHIVFPFVIVVAALHAPLLLFKNLGTGPSDLYFAVMGIGLIAFAGVLLEQLFAQRQLYPNWLQKMKVFPLFMAGSMGLSLSNTWAIAEAVFGIKSPFVRTPKLSLESGSNQRVWANKYVRYSVPPIVWVEVAMTIYSLMGLVLAIAVSEWLAVPFQALFALGFGMVSGYSLLQAWDARKASMIQPTELTVIGGSS